MFTRSEYSRIFQGLEEFTNNWLFCEKFTLLKTCSLNFVRSIILTATFFLVTQFTPSFTSPIKKNQKKTFIHWKSMKCFDKSNSYQFVLFREFLQERKAPPISCRIPPCQEKNWTPCYRFNSQKQIYWQNALHTSILSNGVNFTISPKVGLVLSLWFEIDYPGHVNHVLLSSSQCWLVVRHLGNKHRYFSWRK